MPSCSECGGELVIRNEDRPLDNLPGVVVRDAEVETCPTCGAEAEVYAAMGPLFDQVARALVGKRGRLASTEVRFLRGLLGLSGRALAKRLGVTPESVSRWERDREPIGTTPDRLLRLLAVVALKLPGFSPDMLDRVGGEVTPLHMALRWDGKHWREDREPPREAAAEARA